MIVELFLVFVFVCVLRPCIEFQFDTIWNMDQIQPIYCTTTTEWIWILIVDKCAILT